MGPPSDKQQVCTPECERAPICTVCHRYKQPVGRSVPLEMTNGVCSYECLGYLQDPTPGHLWPGELRSLTETP